MRIDRRTWLKLAAGAGVLATTGAGMAQSALPADVGRKFARDGTVLPFAGNTVLCHLPQHGADAEPFRALMDLYRVLPVQAFAARFVPLPSHSLHMTVFGGANDQDRVGANWPAGVPRTLSIEQCTRLLTERLAHFDSELTMPITMAVDPMEGMAGDERLTIYLRPSDDGQKARLADVRNRLSALLGIRNASHDSYQFHITLAYRTQPMSQDEAQAFKGFRTQWHRTMAQRCPEIRLGPLEFCAFADMFHFDRRLFLD